MKSAQRVAARWTLGKRKSNGFWFSLEMLALDSSGSLVFIPLICKRQVHRRGHYTTKGFDHESMSLSKTRACELIYQAPQGQAGIRMRTLPVPT
jgi:hypothetical protein